MLTPAHLSLLRQDLTGLANIEYDDVMTELLDHYASLTEQKMATGMPFEDASQWAWADLGSGTGLQAVQDDYIKNIQQQIRIQHANILKSYFRWPAFMTTALVGALVYLTVPMLPTIAITIAFWTLLLIPVFISMWGHRKSVDRQTSSSPIVFQYMQRSGGLFINLMQVGLNLSGGLLGDAKRQTFFEMHTSVVVILYLLTLLYTVSYIQLFHKQFIYTVKTA